jgi:REP element-mobilizing transposase RayT
VGAAISNRRLIAVKNRDTRNDYEIENLKKKYYTLRKKYIKAYNELLDAEKNPKIDLSKSHNTEILVEALHFWEEKKLINHAFTIMPNHVHWVFELLEKDKDGKPVYLQDILQSVKRHTANQINKVEGRTGTLWQKESFDTTIRNEKHLYYAMQIHIEQPGFGRFGKRLERLAGFLRVHGCGDF